MDLSHIFNSKKFFSIATCAMLIFFLSFSAFSQEHASSDTAHATTAEPHDAKPEKEEDISKMILHHIADSHEWHFFGHVAVPLPVILLTDKTLCTIDYKISYYVIYATTPVSFDCVLKRWLNLR
jgi:F-type H+-transporting ATPase subunit a